MENIHILLYYKFENIFDVAAFRREHEQFCKRTGLLGKVLIAHEGINGSVSGTKEQTEAYKQFLHSLPGFSDVVFKEEVSGSHPFTKMIVKVKKEIIRLDQEVDMSRVGAYIEPKDFLDLMKSGEEFILLDTRNDYESAVGKFKGALTPSIKTFREFPNVTEEMKDMKDKKIVMYCTGGIRCEKASAYMKQQGFTNVSQLHGGIIRFCQEYPDTVWEGKCFVFDKRLLSSVEADQHLLTHCHTCGVHCDHYTNCNNRSCDALIPLCKNCMESSKGCCSRRCMEAYGHFLQQKMISNRTKLPQSSLG